MAMRKPHCQKAVIKVEEIWKDIPGYEGLYQVSNLGRVYSVKRRKIMKQETSIHGYKRIGLSKNSKPQHHSIHSLVLSAFVGERNGRSINHIDRDKTNNKLSNLEYCTRSYNMQHAYETGHSKKRAVNMLDDNGNILKTFDSLAKAERATGARFLATRIKKGQHSAGYRWQYREEIKI